MKRLLFAMFSALVFSTSALESPYGICAHVSRFPEFKNAAKELEIIKNNGIGWVRTDFDWKFIQKKQGEWDYSHLDSLMKTAAEKDVQILPILGYDVKWAVPVYDNLDLWREYVRRTVSRYAKQCRYWEVWNEANMNNNPRLYTTLNAENYTKVLKAAYEEIKKIDPGLKVLYTGTAGVPIPYIEKTLQAGAAQYFDILNIHPYVWHGTPERVKMQLDPLFALMKKYNLNKPVWVTEFSWATNKNHSAAQPVLRAALEKLRIDPKSAAIGVVRNPPVDSFFGDEYPAEDFTEGVFSNRKNLSLDDLKTVDPAQIPVLVPSLTETFPQKYFKHIVEYVRKGGVLVLIPNGFPFYYDEARAKDGKPVRIDIGGSALKKLHIAWSASWTDKVPAFGKTSFAPGISVSAHIPSGPRYLSAKNLAPGDELIPVVIQSSAKYSAPVAGIYKLNSDLKGAVIMSVIRSDNNGVSQETQAKFLPRAVLGFLADNMEKVFWYNFYSAENNSFVNGHHFGIVHKDFSQKDAGKAYKFLTLMHPAGSTRPQLKTEGNLYTAEWKRPDGRTVFAVWRERGMEQFSPSFPVREAYDYLGGKLNGDSPFTVSGKIIYLVK